MSVKGVTRVLNLSSVMLVVKEGTETFAMYRDSILHLLRNSDAALRSTYVIKYY